MTEWQPIDTAPRDGTWVLIAAQNLYPCDAQWAKGDYCEGWCDIGGFFSTQPTHWMPLPPCP